MPKLSYISNNIIGQPMFNLLSEARRLENEGKYIIHFEIGDPNFDSPQHAIDFAKKALDNKLTHYTDSFGLKEFRESICDYTELNWGFKPNINQVLSCPANAIIDFVIRCTVNKGEEVIYPDPGFSTYFSVLKYHNIVPIGIPLREEKNFRISPEDIYDQINYKTKLIIINSPNNPTGAVMTEDEVSEIYQIAKENNIFLLSDEVYSRIIFDKKHFSPSKYDYCKENVILLNSLSKSFSMSGWRLGYAIGPEKLIEKMGLLLQTIISCQPAFTQYGGIAILKNNKEYVDNIVKILKERRDVLISNINKIPKLSCVIPDGAFYIFVNIKDTNMTSDEFSDKLLLSKGICVLPGNCFGEWGEGYIRMCYASTSIELIEKAIYKIREFINDSCS